MKNVLGFALLLALVAGTAVTYLAYDECQDLKQQLQAAVKREAQPKAPQPPPKPGELQFRQSTLTASDEISLRMSGNFFCSKP